jgi:glycine cleavage system H protein
VQSDERFPDDVRYSEQHDWARVSGATAKFGITWYAQDQLGEIVLFDPPRAGATVTRGEPYSELESVKAVSDVIAPLSGEIVAVNTTLSADPSAVNRDPYGDGWLVEVRLSDPAELDGLIDAGAYRIRVGA